MTTSPVTFSHDVVEIDATNSISFLQAAFALTSSETVFCISRDDTQLSDFIKNVEQHTLPAQAANGWVALPYEPKFTDKPAQIVFTSGTEGRPKPVVLSQRNIADVTTRLNSAMNVTSDIREYVGVPVTYSFGLGRMRAVAAAGGKAFLPERFDPSEIRQLLLEDQINAISAVPSLWRIVLTQPAILQDVGNKVRWIEIGSQYMAAEDKRAIKALFPNACILQHYGLTEASRSTFQIISDCDDSELETVGRAYGTVEVKHNDQEAICIRGDHVALGQLDTSGKLNPLVDADGWLTTKDRGTVQDGLVRYLGRLDDLVNISGAKVGAEWFEDEIIRLVPRASGHVAATGIPDPARGEKLLLAVEAPAHDQDALILEAAKLVLSRRGIAATGALELLNITELPRTGTNKIQRSRLVDFRASENVKAEIKKDLVPLSDDEQRLATVWRTVLGDVTLDPDASFFDLGGDSLSSVQIGMAMEAAGFSRQAVSATLQGQPLRKAATSGGELAAESNLAIPDKTTVNWSINAVRGLMVLSVLFSHWGPGVFERLGVNDLAEQMLSVFYRMGTPGFGMVFGIGIGAYLLPAYKINAGSVSNRMFASFKLVFIGLLLIASLKLTNYALKGELNPLNISRSFYNILAFYAMALISAPLWMRGLARLKDPIAVLPILAFASWLLWIVAGATLSPDMQDTLIEWPRRMLVAGYSIFRLSAAVLAGAVIGAWIVQQTVVEDAGKRLVCIGGAALAASVAVILQAYGPNALSDRLQPSLVSLVGHIMYLSIVAFLLGLSLLFFRRWSGRNAIGKIVMKYLIVFGGLALPIYVFHGLVIPGKDLLSILGAPGILALGLPMGIFLIGLAIGARRMYRMYFS